MGVMHPRLTFVGVDILTNLWFMGHNFGSTYARKLITSSKDSDDNLASKKCWAKKLAHRIGVQGQVKLAIKPKNTLLVTSPQEHPKPQNENFLVETRSLAESVDGLNTSLALSAGELWLK